ncbi:MAG: hypothetical protein LBD52_00610, partial [Prevotellaceae bacterium]|nr:hypothetical protein [Prevotellaceae bacterium]
MKNPQTAVKIKSKKPLLSKWVVTVIISLAVFLLQNPLLIILPNFGLDPSWQLGLSWAVKKGLALGSDFAFTYGPLHFLSHGVMNLGDPSMLMSEFLIYAAIYFLTVFIIVYQLVAMFYRQPWKTYSIIDKLLLIGGLLFFTFMKMHLGETILIINCILFIRLIFEIDCT